MRQAVTQPLERVPAGARLAADLLDAQGHLLLPRDAELTARLRERLQGKVSQVTVWKEVEVSAADQQAALDKLQARLDRLFSLVPKTPAMVQLKRILLRFHRGRLE